MKLPLRSPFSKFIKVKCSDGSERIVYKDPNHAFPLEINDLSVKIGTEIDAMKQLQLKTSAEVERLFRSFLFEIDETNRSLPLHFRALYIAYVCNPCRLDRWLAKQVEEIVTKETKMRDCLSRLRLKIVQGQDIKSSLSNALQELASKKVDVSSEIEKSLENAKKWKEEAQ